MKKNRKLLVIEKDNTIRTANFQETKYLRRRGTFIRAKHLKGLGNRKKRRLKLSSRVRMN